jgi:hypothetical protein
MTAFTHPDRSLTRRIIAAASDTTAVNGWLVRQLPLLFQRAGLVDVRARGFFPLETHLQSFYAGMADRCAQAAVKAGAVSEPEGRAWLRAFHELGAGGPVIAGRLHICVWGRKPDEAQRPWYGIRPSSASQSRVEDRTDADTSRPSGLATGLSVVARPLLPN